MRMGTGLAHHVASLPRAWHIVITQILLNDIQCSYSESFLWWWLDLSPNPHFSILSWSCFIRCKQRIGPWTPPIPTEVLRDLTKLFLDKLLVTWYVQFVKIHWAVNMYMNSTWVLLCILCFCSFFFFFFKWCLYPVWGSKSQPRDWVVCSANWAGQAPHFVVNFLS